MTYPHPPSILVIGRPPPGYLTYCFAYKKIANIYLLKERVKIFKLNTLPFTVVKWPHKKTIRKHSSQN